MKILQVASGDFFSTYGGGQVYVKNLIDAFINYSKVNNKNNRDNNNNVTTSVISFISNLLEPRKQEYKGIDLWEVPANCSEEVLSEIIKEINPDIIHAHSMKHLVCRIGKKIDKPVVITAHHGGIYCLAGAAMDCKDRICDKKVSHKNCLPCVLRNTRTGLKFWYPFMKYLPKEKYVKIGNYLGKKKFIPFITPIGLAGKAIKEKQKQWEEIIEKSTKVIAPSNKIAETMVLNGMSKDKIKVIPHGIPLPKLQSSFPEIKNGKIKFFYVGRISYIKGLHILLGAFNQIKEPYIELHLIGGAGNKGENRYMKRLQQKYEKDSRIIWHDKIEPEEIYNKIKDYHIAISPTICLESFGLNISEALALGKPVLSTQNGGGEMQIKDGINGWIVAANNVMLLKEKIEEIIINPFEIKKMSLNCKTHSIENHLQSLIEIYKLNEKI